MTTPALKADRSMWVRPGQTVGTAWVHVDQCALGSRERMDMAAIEQKYRNLLQMGECQSWPPIVGHWAYGEANGQFIVDDGRHEFLAALALGREQVFVAWLVDA